MTPSAAEIAACLSGRRIACGWVARCPAHDDSRPSLSIRATDDGRVLVRCFAGCHQEDVIAALRARGLWRNPLSDRDRARRVCKQRAAPAMHTVPASHISREVALRVWRSATAATGTLVEAYLRARGIVIPVPRSLRFVARAWHRPSQRFVPAMVAGVQAADRRVVAVHRTFLADDGHDKAPALPNKMMLGPCSGGAVRFTPPGAVLAIAEGIETGLSVLQATGLPTWSALSSSGVAALVLPPLPSAREVVIFADHDRAGIEAAQRAAVRFVLEGRRARIARPDRSGLDFNDLLRGVA